MYNQYTPKQTIERMKISLIRNPRFACMAGVMMLGDTIVTTDIPTACTDGRNVKFNPNFFMGLSAPEQRALIYHEYAGHIMYQHLTRFRFMYDIDAKTANQACDYVINQTIKDFNMPEFIKLPEGGLQNDRFRGMDSKRVFDILRAEGTSDDGDGFDEHDWEGAKDRSADEQAVIDREIDQAIRQSVVASKLLGHAVPRALQDWLTPQIDYRQALREFVTQSCAGDDYNTYSRPRRRMLANDIYMPTAMSDSLQEIVVAIDTSYSVTDDHLRQLIPEVVGVCDAVHPDRVHVMYWGTRVVGHEVYDSSNQSDILHTTRPESGGGTSIECVTQYMAEKNITPTCVVVLTDGYLSGTWGQWVCPVLWVMTTDMTAPIGSTVRLTM